MLFNYKAVTKDGEEKVGSLDAFNKDMAIDSLQKNGLVIVSIDSATGKESFWTELTNIFEKVKRRDIVILSRQLATLFEAKVSVLDSFKLLSSETDNPVLRVKLVDITDDVQSGVPVSKALSKHQAVFSPFYVNMVRAAEESGKLPETFNFLADYLERSYELVSKVRNALIYPAFVVGAFVVVMILMLVFVIPRLSEILTETGQEIPIYTRIVIGISYFFANYGIFLLILAIIAAFFLWRWSKTDSGKRAVASAKISIPYVGTLYERFYLARIADNMDTLISSGVSMVRSVEITAEVVGSDVYKAILLDASNSIKSGGSLSAELSRREEVPAIMSQMIKIGEETGNLAFVLKTLARFYRREVSNAIDTMVSLIEPAMIVFLGLAVGMLLISVIGPIYSITSSI